MGKAARPSCWSTAFRLGPHLRAEALRRVQARRGGHLLSHVRHHGALHGQAGEVAAEAGAGGDPAGYARPQALSPPRPAPPSTRRSTITAPATITITDHDPIDGHAWLDPVNAKIMVDRIAQVLAAKEPANAALFRANADALKAKLDALSAELAADLTPIAGKPYIVFHDALQYFERRYRLRVVGSIAISPEMAPSAKRLSDAAQAHRLAGRAVRLRRAAVRHAPHRHGDRRHQGQDRHHRPRGRQDRARPRAVCHAAAQSRARSQGLPRPAGVRTSGASCHGRLVPSTAVAAFGPAIAFWASGIRAPVSPARFRGCCDPP